MELLYSGLDQAAAGEVVTALDQQGVPYDVRGTAIYVPAPQRDALRLSLADQNLPPNGSVGYELLDSQSGFGTTSQMFEAALTRAKEGELARTITASPQIRSARVHIATQPTQSFRRADQPSASVAVTAASGSLRPEQAQAIKHLVAAAITGLEATNVSVVDQATGTVIDGDGAPGAMGLAETERAAMLQRRAQQLVEARVGVGRAVVTVNVEARTDRESILEQTFDPEGRVPVSSEVEERTSSSRGPAGGAVTVASDLPDGEAGAEGERSSQDSETRERTNYEVSSVSREVLREPGGIRRLSVAVLVDGTNAVQPDGSTQWQPMPEEELADLRDLVASAVGLEEERGDQITIKSMPLEQMAEIDAGSGPARSFPLDVMQLAQLGILGAVALALGLFVLRPILSGKPGGGAALPAPTEGGIAVPDPPLLNGEIDDGGFTPPPMNTVSDFDFPGSDDGLPGFPSMNADPVSRLREMIDERRDETLEVLRDWMSDDKERAR
jgi:flagellar M-ring protein FliF